MASNIWLLPVSITEYVLDDFNHNKDRIYKLLFAQNEQTSTQFCSVCIIKQEFAMSIKQIAQSNEDTKKNNSISVCDLLKNNTTKIIRKCETQTPIYTQLYSNYYDEYLHALEDIFGTCYLSEKHFFDSLGIDDKTLNATDKFWKGVTETTMAHIDMYTNFRNLPSVPAPTHSMHRVKAEAVRRVLSDAGGSVAKAAKVFGVHRSTIYRWLQR